MLTDVGALTKKPRQPTAKASIRSAANASRSWIFRVVLDLMKDPSLMIVRCNSNCSREHSVYNSPVYQCVQQPTDEIVAIRSDRKRKLARCFSGRVLLLAYWKLAIK